MFFELRVVAHPEVLPCFDDVRASQNGISMQERILHDKMLAVFISYGLKSDCRPDRREQLIVRGMPHSGSEPALSLYLKLLEILVRQSSCHGVLSHILKVTHFLKLHFIVFTH
jgi:hypothetical protein